MACLAVPPIIHNDLHHPHHAKAFNDVMTSSSPPIIHTGLHNPHHAKAFNDVMTSSSPPIIHNDLHHPHHTQAFNDVMTPSSPPKQAYQFTEDEINRALYGYIHTSCNGMMLKHALSDVRFDSEKDGYYPSYQKEISAIPESLSLVHTDICGVSHTSVFCVQGILRKGTVFGPYQGCLKPSHDSDHDLWHDSWEMFKDGILHAYIDGNTDTSNWMKHINTARFAQEQNLVVIQRNNNLYYECCKDIPEGTELLVWYGDCYAQFMGIPIGMKDVDVGRNGIGQTGVDNHEGYKCDRCGKLFAYQYYRDKHLKYTRCVDTGDREYPCQLCKRSFEKRDRLRIHILHVHEKHRPHVCNVCGKSFSQSSSLNKHLRVHSGERPYKCSYCSKCFTASSILRTHLRQHSGEKPFKCRHCGRTFASHAAHDSHERRTHGQ